MVTSMPLIRVEYIEKQIFGDCITHGKDSGVREICLYGMLSPLSFLLSSSWQ